MKKEELKFYGSIGGEINADSFTEQLMSIENSGCTDLVIRMHCYGGSVFEGNVIYNAIANSKMNISIIIDGIAASMASIIILASKNVQIAENGFVMVHRPMSGSLGNADELQQSVKLLNDMEINFINVISSRSGLSEDEVKTKWFDGKDHWLNADEAIKYGFAKSKINSVAKDIKELNKSSVSKLSVKNVYDKFSSKLTKNDVKMKKDLIDLFQLDGVTESSSDDAVLAALKEKKQSLETMANQSKQQVQASIRKIVSKGVEKGFIPVAMFDDYVEIGQNSGIEKLERIIDNMHVSTKPRIVDMLKKDDNNTMITSNVSAEKKPKHQWSLDDYRMYAPNELRDNSSLYEELCNKEFGK